ncbi:hypothetical protein [Sphingomonas sp.]|uniref:hypothetical protein n=1 Tax=Sphingomonas sp. TaxID=28214 RepID=UPI0025D91C92|nr:hypothetical protein [Sphingomonas sp.]
MPEPITTVGMGAIVAYLGKDGLEKLLGPTAAYLGDGLKNFTEKRAEAVGKIFKRASEKLGDKADPGAAVPPKVLKQIVDDGSFATEDLEIEYLSGVLISSKSKNDRDNRGASIAAMISSLSNYQLRAHFIFYNAMRESFRTAGIFPDMAGRPRMATFIASNDFANAMDLNAEERTRATALISHITFGLHRNALIENFQFGSKEGMINAYPNIDAEGIVFQPSVAGIELFLWAFGAPNKDLDYIFSPNFSPATDDIKLLNIPARPAKLP